MNGASQLHELLISRNGSSSFKRHGISSFLSVLGICVQPQVAGTISVSYAFHTPFSFQSMLLDAQFLFLFADAPCPHPNLNIPCTALQLSVVFREYMLPEHAK